MAVEHELVLAADEVAERDVRRVVAGSGHEHLLAVLGLADVERRGRQVDEQRRPGEREVGRRRARLPDVLADRETDERVAELEQEELPSGGEVPVLVEHAVVRQEVLAVDALDLALGADEGRVREVAVERRGSDERDRLRGRARDLVDRLARGADEPGAQEEILRRVAGDGELGQDDDVGGGALASWIAPTIRSTFPSRSPTTTLSCASAILTGASSPLRGRAAERFSTHDHKRHSKRAMARDGDDRPALPRPARRRERRLRGRSARRSPRRDCRGDAPPAPFARGRSDGTGLGFQPGPLPGRDG